MKKIILIILCLFTLTGCYNYEELDDLSLISSILIDYKENNYNVSVEVYADDEKVKIYDGDGSSLTDALEDAEAKSPKTFYYRHINAVIMTDSVNIPDVIYYFFRNPDTNDNFAFVNTKTTEIYEDEEVNIGDLIKNTLQYEDLYSFFGVIKSFINETKDLSLPLFDGKKLAGIKTYKNNEGVNSIEGSEEETLKVLLNESDSYLDATCNGGNFVINIDSVKTKYDVNNNKIKIDAKLEANIEELTCDLDITKVDDLKRLEKYASDALKEDIKELIEVLKEDETDILGINTLIKNKYHKLKKKFNDYDYDVNIDISIYKKGLLLR